MYKRQTVECLKTEDSDVIILADGMGSGVKANILSTLTAKILGTMFLNGATLEECVETIVQTLPDVYKRQGTDIDGCEDLGGSAELYAGGEGNQYFSHDRGAERERTLVCLCRYGRREHVPPRLKRTDRSGDWQ